MPETSDLLDSHRRVIEQFTEAILRPYLVRLDQRPPEWKPEPKEINDAIWGTLTLQPLEIVVLDSPLLQRLRHIRQLGVVHFVYPTAGHSRLEHSIGVAHLVDRLVSSMNDAATGGAQIDEHHRQLLRLAGLCHDIGHGAMSHVSENALEECDKVADLLIEFKKMHGDGRSLSEINASLMIESPAFGELITKAAARASVGVMPNFTELMAKIIVGERINDDKPTLHELISGPFDADKLDWMTRDARMCGIPVVSDVNRLIQKARAVRVDPKTLPRHLAERIHNASDVLVVGIARSGNRTIDEITLGRTLIFDKVYRHHKVRAAERMVAAIFRSMTRDDAALPDAALLPLELTDNDLLEFDEVVMSRVTGTEVDVEHRAYRVALDMSARLRERRILDRALTFSSKMPGDAYGEDPEHVRGLDRLIRELGDRVRQLEVGETIAGEAEKIIGLTGETGLLGEFPDRSLTDYVVIEPPKPAPNLPTTKALLIEGTNRVVGFEVEAPETPAWANNYHQTREVGYVFAPDEVALHVGLAAQAVLRRDYGIRSSDLWLVGSKDRNLGTAALRSRLVAEGYYTELPRDLKPVPDRLQMADVPEAVARIRDRLSSYSMPLIDPDELRETSVSARRIQDFVAQFEDDDLIDAALAALQHLKLVGREDIVSSVVGFLESHSDFANASLVPLGTPKDSSAINTYYANDVAKKYPGLQVRDLSVALNREDPIIFIDDITESGTQAAAIVGSWFGDESLAKELGEERQDLQEPLRQLLRERQVAMIFATGTARAKQQIEETASRFDFHPEVYVATDCSAQPRCFDAVEYKSEAQMEAFRVRCGEIGTQLLADDPKAENRILGYGNNAYLLVFPYNTPSQTLTCLWKDGTVDGAPWQPLLPRRKKL